MKNNILLLILFFATKLQAQFAPPAGTLGSTAIHKDSTCFVAWATQCDINRGWLNILDTTQGKATVGNASSAIGMAGLDGVVSLGDAGSAILQFQHPIYNGPGYDFAVFENSFRDDFLELAFVEVSSDGINYKRFPATSFIDTSIQVDSFGLIDCRQVNNLAGKYRALYGTPFDLDELALFSDIDLMNITHVRIIDVVGSIDNVYASRDKDGRKINDPFPTPYPSCGFDLDAVGVIHGRWTNSISDIDTNPIIHSNFINRGEYLQLNNIDSKNKMALIDMNGKIINEYSNVHSIYINNDLAVGIYLLKIEQANNSYTFKIAIKNEK